MCFGARRGRSKAFYKSQEIMSKREKSEVNSTCKLYRNVTSEAGIAKQTTNIRGSPPSWEVDGAATIGRWTEGRIGPRRLLEMRMSF